MNFPVQVIGTLWKDAAFLLTYSLHHYYSPQTLVADHTLPVGSFAVLFAVAAGSLAAAAWRFQRRDIP